MLSLQVTSSVPQIALLHFRLIPLRIRNTQLGIEIRQDDKTNRLSSTTRALNSRLGAKSINILISSYSPKPTEFDINEPAAIYFYPTRIF